MFSKGDCSKCDMHTKAKSYLSSFVFNQQWNTKTFFFIHLYNKSDNSLWSLMLGESHQCCWVLVYIIEPVWQISFVGRERISFFFFFFFFFLGGVAMVLQHRCFIQKNIRYKYHMQSWIWIWYALITSCSDHYTDDVWNPSLPKAVIGLSRCNRSLDPSKYGRKKKRQKVNKAQQEQPENSHHRPPKSGEPHKWNMKKIHSCRHQNAN